MKIQNINPAKAIILIIACCASLPVHAALIITGIIDGPRTGGTPKAIEIYVSTAVADLSIYDIQNYNNGGGTASTTFALSGSAAAGTFIYVASESTNFNTYFGFTPTYTTGALNVNGNDVVALRLNSTIIDSFGVIGVDPAVDTAWNYLDTWFYRNDGTSASATFTLADWTSAPGQSDALDPRLTTGTNVPVGGADSLTMPIGTYTPAAIPEPSRALLLGLGSIGLIFRRRRQ
jgi:predicted extracellular nuclease